MPAGMFRNSRNGKLRVGDRVVLHLGTEDVFAEVVEDRGFIGVGGRQLLAIRRTGVAPEISEPYEVPAEELELVRRKGRAAPARHKAPASQRPRVS